MASRRFRHHQRPADSKALYRAQKLAARPNSLFFALLGLISSGRKVVIKAVSECQKMEGEPIEKIKTEQEPTSELPNGSSAR